MVRICFNVQVTNSQASRLAQVGRRLPIGQSVCRMLMCMRGALVREALNIKRTVTRLTDYKLTSSIQQYSQKYTYYDCFC